MSEALRIIVNGRERAVEGVAEKAGLNEVLAALDLKADRIAVEHNGEIAPRATWSSVPVVSGDRLEVVHFVGGGCARQRSEQASEA